MNNNNDCPIFMMDGRAFTDYRAKSVINAELMKKLNVTDVDSYRMMLQEKGEELIKNQMNSVMFKNKCDCADFSNMVYNNCSK